MKTKPKYVLVVDFAGSVHDYSSSLFKNCQVDGDIKLIYLSSKPLLNSVSHNIHVSNQRSILAIVMNTIGLLRCVISYNVTVVHWQFVQLYFLSYVINSIFKKFGIKFVYTAHNTTPFHGQKGFVKAIQSFGYGRFLKSCDHIVVHSEYSASMIKGFNRKISIIPHGLLGFSDDLKKGDNQETKTSSLSLNREVTVLFFGHMVDYKGIDRFLACAESILKKFPQVRWVFAGNASKLSIDHRRFLQRLSSQFQNLVFHPKFVGREQADQFFKQATVLLLPYRHIDDSGVLSASIHYGVPAIVSQLPGFEARGLNSTNSYVMNSFSFQDWENIVEKLIDIKCYQSKRDNVINLRFATPTWDEIWVKTRDVYDKMGN